MIVSRNGKDYPRLPPLDADALLKRELVWSRLPEMTYHGIISCLSVGGCLSLDSAMTDREMRPYLMKAYKGLVSAVFNGYLYSDEGDYLALRWVMKRGIDLRGFTVKVRGDWGRGTRQSGELLVMLMDYGPKGDLGIARYYAMRGKLEDVDKGRGGHTALTRASIEGHKDIVEALLAAGADTEKADRQGHTALIWASMNGHTRVVKALLAAGADTEKADGQGYTALMRAAERGHIEVVEALLAAGVDTEKADEWGHTALIWASTKGRTRVVEALLAAGADTEKADEWGDTALMRAAGEGHIKVVEALLAAGADTEKTNEDEQCALMEAARGGHVEVVSMLKKLK